MSVLAPVEFSLTGCSSEDNAGKQQRTGTALFAAYLVAEQTDQPIAGLHCDEASPARDEPPGERVRGASRGEDGNFGQGV